MSRCRSCDGRSLCKCRECRWLRSYARLHVYAWVGVLACALTCSRGVRVCEREGAQVQRTCVHTMQVCIMVYMPCITLRLGPGDARSCSRDTHRMRITPRKSSGEYIHNRQQIHDVTDSAESFIGPLFIGPLFITDLNQSIINLSEGGE